MVKSTKDPVSLSLLVVGKRSQVFFGGLTSQDVSFVHQGGEVVRKLVTQMSDFLTVLGGILVRVVREIKF
ncbi:hypothetical protein CFII68_19808 [Pseudomonas sp. CFII68]|nr:hypothetical protein CFII68_19808 [Pseudomonas sp. CFII68]